MSALVDRSALVSELKELRASGKISRVVLANGCFDLLHVGHVRYLSDAASRGDLLVVALNTDESVSRLKGPSRPLITLEDRAEIVGALACVGRVTSFDEETLEETLRALLPEVHAKGTDYTLETLPERDVDEELGIEVAICGDPKTRSSSDYIEKV